MTMEKAAGIFQARRNNGILEMKNVNVKPTPLYFLRITVAFKLLSHTVLIQTFFHGVQDVLTFKSYRKSLGKNYGTHGGFIKPVCLLIV